MEDINNLENTSADDLFVFADDDNPSSDENNSSHTDEVNKESDPWKILIVDDDEEIHAMTKMVIGDYSFEDRPFLMYSAYSRLEAIEILKEHDDIALILLDVVMETDDAGLNCVRDIREKLKNQVVRIILRTGQPGQAPEQDVIVNYDINDYKAKTELTTQKLFTVVIASLRAYNHINTINQNKRGLENIIKASNRLFEMKSFSLFANGILQQLTSILMLDKSSLYINSSSLSVFSEDVGREYNVLAATGEFAGVEKIAVKDAVSEEVHALLMAAVESRSSIFTDNTYTGFFETKKGEHTLLYLQWQRPLTPIDRDLISIFATNIAIAFENISLNNEIISTQKEIIYILSEVVEGRSKETANHIRRVAEVSMIIAQKMNFSEHDINMIQFTAPMHDIGKIGTPETILKKPGKLTDKEYEIIKEHSELGYDFFSHSGREMMKVAAIIAHQHHEKWNGEGYPLGLQGENIHIFGRIVAVADVVDALVNKRCYKEPWEMDQVVQFLKEERGGHFDPDVVDAFLESLDEYDAVRKKYPI